MKKTLILTIFSILFLTSCNKDDSNPTSSSSINWNLIYSRQESDSILFDNVGNGIIRYIDYNNYHNFSKIYVDYDYKADTNYFFRVTSNMLINLYYNDNKQIRYNDWYNWKDSMEFNYINNNNDSLYIRVNGRIHHFVCLKNIKVYLK